MDKDALLMECFDVIKQYSKSGFHDDTLSRITVALSEPQGDGWIKCSERLPEPKKWVLVHNGAWIGVGKHCPDWPEIEEKWQSETGEFITLLGPKVTHWRPMPPLPKE